jgi:hypothetical protein
VEWILLILHVFSSCSRCGSVLSTPGTGRTTPPDDPQSPKRESDRAIEIGQTEPTRQPARQIDEGDRQTKSRRSKRPATTTMVRERERRLPTAYLWSDRQTSQNPRTPTTTTSCQRQEEAYFFLFLSTLGEPALHFGAWRPVGTYFVPTFLWFNACRRPDRFMKR